MRELMRLFFAYNYEYVLVEYSLSSYFRDART